MRAVRSLAIVLVLTAQALGQSPPAERPEGPRRRPEGVDEKIWRTANKCGANVIYVMASLLAKQPVYEEVERRVPIGDAGTTLAQLRDSARVFGLHLKIAQGTPEALLACRFPVIAHYEEEQGTTGHYVVVLAANANEVHFVDGTSAMIGRIPMSDFRRRWSGYLLVPDEGRPWRMMSPVLAVAGVALVGAALFYRRRAVLSQSTHPSNDAAPFATSPSL